MTTDMTSSSPQRRKALSTPPVASAYTLPNMSIQRSQSGSTRTLRPSATPSYKRASYQQNVLLPLKNVSEHDEALESVSADRACFEKLISELMLEAG